MCRKSARVVLFSILSLVSLILVQSSSAEVTRKWLFEAEADGQIFSSPAIDKDGTVYFGTFNSAGGFLYAVSPDGNLKWSEPVKLGGVTSSPTIGLDGTIYVGSFDTTLCAFDPEDGSEKWKSMPIASIATSPALSADGDTVYVGADDGRIHAFDAQTGAKRWEYPSDQEGGLIQSSPAVSADGATLYVGTNVDPGDNYLYAITLGEASAELKWKFPTGEPVISSPAIDGERIFVGSDDGFLYAIRDDEITGTLMWRFPTSSPVSSSPAVGKEAVYVGSEDGYIYAVNPDDGVQLWRFPPVGDDPVGAIFSSPAIGADGKIYIGSSDGTLYVLNPDGSESAVYATGSDPEHDPVPGAIDASPAIALDGTVYFGSLNSKLYALQSTSLGLADSPWPTMQHDNQRTGRVGGGARLRRPKSTT
jgi:outer membrane protein assembly factor BamB